MKTRFDKTQQELAAALHALRLLVREVGNNYIAGLQTDVARASEAIKSARPGRARDRKQLAQLTTMLRWINALEVKPQKGRRRDVKELDRVISKLNDVVDNW